jgi:hypothetical protein
VRVPERLHQRRVQRLHVDDLVVRPDVALD